MHGTRPALAPPLCLPLARSLYFCLLYPPRLAVAIHGFLPTFSLPAFPLSPSVSSYCLSLVYLSSPLALPPPSFPLFCPSLFLVRRFSNLFASPPPLSLRPSPVPLRCAQSPTRFSSSSLASQATRLVHGKLIVSRSPAALVFVSGFDILPFLLLASVSSNVHSSIVFARHDHFLFPTRYIYIYACLLSIKQFIRILYIYIFIRSINRRIAFQMRLKLFR